MPDSNDQFDPYKKSSYQKPINWVNKDAIKKEAAKYKNNLYNKDALTKGNKALSVLGKTSRAKGKRAIARMAKQIESPDLTLNEKATLKAMTLEIAKTMGQTYIPREQRIMTKQFEIGLKHANARLQSLVEASKLGIGKRGAANLAFQYQINLASKVSSDTMDDLANPSALSREEVKIFYKSTQAIWQSTDGTPTDTAKINRKIMKYFKTGSLEEAWNRVLENPRNKYALDVATGEINPNAELTEEQKQYYDMDNAQDTDQQKEKSPDFLIYSFQFNPDLKWNKQ